MSIPGEFVRDASISPNRLSGVTDYVLYRRTTSQTINNNTWTTVNYDEATEAGLGQVTTGASWNYLVPVDGIIIVHAIVLYENISWPVDSRWQMRVSVNDTRFVYGELHGADDPVVNTFTGVKVDTAIAVEVGDVVRFQTWQVSGSSRSIATNTPTAHNLVTLRFTTR